MTDLLDDNASNSASAADTTAGEAEVKNDQTSSGSDDASNPELSDPFADLGADEDEDQDDTTSSEDDSADDTADTDEDGADDTDDSDDSDADSSDDDDGGSSDQDDTDTSDDDNSADDSSTDDKQDRGEPRKSAVQRRIDTLTRQKAELAQQVKELREIESKIKPVQQGMTDAELQEQMELIADKKALERSLGANVRVLEAEQKSIEDEVVSNARVEWLEAEREYPVLDKKSKQFKPDVHKRVFSFINKQLKADPYQSVGELVADVMSIGKLSANAKASEISNKITKQIRNQTTPVGAGGSRNNSTLTPEAIEAMSDEEYQKRLPEINKWLASR